MALHGISASGSLGMSQNANVFNTQRLQNELHQVYQGQGVQHIEGRLPSLGELPRTTFLRLDNQQARIFYHYATPSLPNLSEDNKILQCTIVTHTPAAMEAIAAKAAAYENARSAEAGNGGPVVQPGSSNEVARNVPPYPQGQRPPFAQRNLACATSELSGPREVRSHAQAWSADPDNQCIYRRTYQLLPIPNNLVRRATRVPNAAIERLQPHMPPVQEASNPHIEALLRGGIEDWKDTFTKGKETIEFVGMNEVRDPSGRGEANRTSTLEFKLQGRPFTFTHQPGLGSNSYFNLHLHSKLSGESFRLIDFGTHTGITMTHARELAAVRDVDAMLAYPQSGRHHLPPPDAVNNDLSYDIETYTGFPGPEFAMEVMQIVDILSEKLPSAQ